MKNNRSGATGEREVENFYRHFAAIEQALFQMQERIEERTGGDSDRSQRMGRRGRSEPGARTYSATPNSAKPRSPVPQIARPATAPYFAKTNISTSPIAPIEAFLPVKELPFAGRGSVAPKVARRSRIDDGQFPEL